MRMASACRVLYAAPDLLTVERLDQTLPCDWRSPIGVTRRVPAGWNLWMVILEHEAVEHAADLYATLPESA